MFKKFTILQLAEEVTPAILKLVRENEEVFSEYKFAPPTKAEKSRMGFSTVPLDGKFVSEYEGNLILKVTSQGKSINPNEVKDLVKVASATWMTENNKDSVPKNVKKALQEDAELDVIKRTYPKEATHGYVIIRKDGKVLVDGKGKHCEDIVSLIRKCVGTLPATPYQPTGDINDLLKDWVVTGLTGDIFTLGAKATILSEQGTEYKTKGDDISQDPNALNILKTDNSMVTSLEVNYDGIMDLTFTDIFSVEGIKFSKDLLEDSESAAASLIITFAEIEKVVDILAERLDG